TSRPARPYTSPCGTDCPPCMWRNWPPPSRCAFIHALARPFLFTVPPWARSCWHMPEDEQDRVLPELDLKRLTPNSVGNLQELKTELYRVRKNGYACDLEEHELHIRCVAAPIWDHTGSVQSSLSITAPTLRMPVTRLRRLAPLIQTAGMHISAELGYQPTVSLSPLTALNRSGKTEARLGKMVV